MEHTTQQDFSKLERELTEALRLGGNEGIRTIRDLMNQMATLSETQIIYSSYPACNSGT